MNKQELIKWFNEKLMNCYHIKKDDSIFWIYDKNFVRARKLASIDGTYINIPKEIKGDVLFQQDLKNEYFWCNQDKIWLFFEANYSPNYIDVQSFIKTMLCDIDNLKQYTPDNTWVDCDISLCDIENLKQYTPKVSSISPLPSWMPKFKAILNE